MDRVFILFLLMMLLMFNNANAEQSTSIQYFYLLSNNFFKPFDNYKSQINESFIILPSTSLYKKYTYENCSIKKSRNKYYNYKKLVGKIAILKDVKLTNNSIPGDIDFCSEYYLPKSKKIVYLRSSCSRNDFDKAWQCAGNKVLNTKSIDNIKNKYMNKALFLRKKTDLYIDLNKRLSNAIKLEKYTPVKIINAFVGSHTDPIALQVTSNQNTGFLFVKNETGIEQLFYSKNPKNLYKWSDLIWKKINEEKLWLGMTKKQAIMSWGKPYDINKNFGSFKNHEQWLYGNSYLYFEKDKLTSWQD